MDSLETEFQIAKHDTTRLNILYKLMDLCEVKDNLKYAEPVVDICEQNLEKLGNKDTLRIFYSKHLGTALNVIGYFYYQKGNTLKAINYYNKSMKTLEEINDKKVILNTIINLANLYSEIGNKDKADSLYLMAKETNANIFDKKNSSAYKFLNQNFLDYYSKGDYLTSLAYTEKALLQSEKEFSINSEQYISSLNNLGIAYRSLGENEKSERNHKKALEIIRTNYSKKNPQYAETLNYLGITLIYSGKYDEAEKTLKEVRKIANKKDDNYLNSLNNTAMIFTAQHKYETALEYYFQSLELYKNNKRNESFGVFTLLDNIGDVYLKTGDFTNAEKYVQESLEIKKRLLTSDHPGIANTYYYLGQLYFYNAQYEKANEQIKQAIPIYLKTYGENSNYVLECYNSLAFIAINLNNPKEAISDFQKTLLIANGEDFILQYVYALSGMARSYYALADYTEAKKYNELFLSEYDKLGNINDPIYSTTLVFSAEIFKSLGEFDKAIDIGKKSLSITKDIYEDKHPEYAVRLNWLGTLYYEAGEINKAYDLFMNSKSIIETGNYKNYPGAIGVYNNLGLLCKEKGELKKAIQYYEYALSLDSSNATILLNLGGLYYDAIGDKDKASVLFNKVIEIQKNTLGINHPSYALSLFNIAIIYKDNEEYEKALDNANNGLSIIKEKIGENNKDYLKGLSVLAGIYYEKKEYDKSLETQQRCLNITKEVYGENSANYAEVLDDLGYVFGKIDKNQELAYYKKSLNIKKNIFTKNHPSYLSTLSNLAYTYYDLKGYEKSESYFSEIIKSQIISTLSVINFLSKTERESYVEDIYNNKFYNDFLAMLPNTSVINNAFNYNLFFKGVLSNSEEYLAKYLNNSKDSSLISMNDKLKSYKNILANAYSSTNVDSLNVLINEMEKKLSRELSNQNSAELGNIFSWDEIRKQFKQNEAAVEIIKFSLKNEKKDFKFFGLGFGCSYDTTRIYPVINKVFDNSPMYNAGIRKDDELIEINGINTRNFTYEYLRSRLNCDSSMKFKINRNGIVIDTAFSVKCDSVFNISNYQNYYAALIVTSETKDHPKVVLLKNGDDLDNTYFLHYQQYLTNPKQRDDKDYESYQYFWAAIDSAIGDKKTVYVSPDGVYKKINLETLVTPDGKYFSDSKDIRIIGSSRDLLQPVSPVRKSIKNALLVGNPNFKSNAAAGDTALLAYNQTANDVFQYTTRSFDNTDISPLPAAEKEVESITQLFKKYNFQTTTLTGNEAQESAVKITINPSVLHIATHGFFEKDLEIKERAFSDFGRKRAVENPMLRSGLLLAGAENTIKGKYDPKDGAENGILTAYEVQQMNLDSTELVVLSACETGLGEVQNGEGVYGLQRAFRIAGAKTIIMSLWKVDDEATQLLMTSFYENWLSGKTKREAFKAAQDILKKNSLYSYPYYWGAFILIGN